MRHTLTAIRAIVDDEAITRLRQSTLSGDSARREQKMSEQRGILLLRLRDARDGFLGDDQDVRGRLRMDVAEGDCLSVLVNDIRGDLPRDDLLEEGHRIISVNFAPRW